MPSSDKGFVLAYNAQATVDVGTMAIVESHISQAANDKQEITPALAALDELPENLGKLIPCGLTQVITVTIMWHYAGSQGLNRIFPQAGTNIISFSLNDSLIQLLCRKRRQ